MRKLTIFILALLPLAISPAGCRSADGLPRDSRTAEADRQCREKWGKGLDDLPTRNLVVLSANNENIQDEFEWAFSLHHAVEYGQKVAFVRRDVGGGGTSQETYLINVYSMPDRDGNPSNPEIDILWGGGDITFGKLAKGTKMKIGGIEKPTGPLLERLDLPADVFENIPAQYAGTPMYDPPPKDDPKAKTRWIGSTLSGFGILYNKGMLAACKIAPPKDWQDLGDGRFWGLVELADPSQSGSAAVAFRTIVLSADTWPEGWAKLMIVMGNARHFADSAGSAANSPALGEALAATCIDFYGTTRALEAPDQLVYFTPAGQSVFTPDPIGVLRGAPHPELAQRFVQFVLSPKGQALWCLPAGSPDGPVRRGLGRQPIRRDTYKQYAGKMFPYIIDPYIEGQAIELTPDKQAVNFNVLRELSGAAGVANRDGISRARKAIIDSPGRTDLMKLFVELPQNVATLDTMANTAGNMKPDQLDSLRRQWRDYFADKYDRIVRMGHEPAK